MDPLNEVPFDLDAAEDVLVAIVPTETGRAELPRPPLRRRLAAAVREWVQFGALLLLIFVGINLVIPRYEVLGNSMEPNFHTYERLLGSPLPYLFGDPERGDIVVFIRPDSGEMLIKRVIGIPGDTVELRSGQVYINGVLLDEPYASGMCRLRQCSEGEWVLGADEYFVMGDNRAVTTGSHTFGAVPRDHILAKVLLRWWPLDAIDISFD